MEEKKKPFRREWLKEAYKIAKGDQTIRIKKEHIFACIEALDVLGQSESQLRLLMKTAYEQACQRRREQGLPIPPPPPFMTNQRGPQSSLPNAGPKLHTVLAPPPKREPDA